MSYGLLGLGLAGSCLLWMQAQGRTSPRHRFMWVMLATSGLTMGLVYLSNVALPIILALVTLAKGKTNTGGHQFDMRSQPALRMLISGANYAPEQTGTGKYTAEMAEWLAQRGHGVHVITGPPHYPEWRLREGFQNKHSEETRNGVHVRRVPMHIPPADDVSAKQRIRMESSFTFHSIRPWLRLLFSRKKPDVIIAVCPPMQTALPAYLYSKLRRVPWVFHIQDLQVDAAIRLGVLKPRGFTKLLYKIEEFFLRRATRVSTITPGMRDRIIEKGVQPDRLLDFPNWSDVTTMAPGPRDNAWRQNLDLRDGQLLLLYAGNMGRKQGLENLLAAARSLQGDDRLQFVLVGDGAARTELEEQAKDLSNVRFMPLQPWELVPEMLNAADIHLIIQKREAADLVMPSKLTNILAVGGCSLATADSGTLHHILTKNDAGLCVVPEDVDALVAGIERLAGDAKRRAAMSHNARAYAKSHLDKDAILGRFEQDLQTILPQHAP